MTKQQIRNKPITLTLQDLKEIENEDRQASEEATAKVKTMEYKINKQKLRLQEMCGPFQELCRENLARALIFDTKFASKAKTNTKTSLVNLFLDAEEGQQLQKMAA